MTSSIYSQAYKTARQNEREIESSRLGPGYVDPYKPFGADAKSFTMGLPHKWKPDQNPPVGGYNTQRAFEKILNTSRSVVIKKATSPYRRPKENNPEPGQYDRHLTKFGSDGQKFSIGLPHKWKPD